MSVVCKHLPKEGGRSYPNRTSYHYAHLQRENLEMSEWYREFVASSYRPAPDDLLCLFRVDPAPGFSLKDAAGRVASESSVGTWTELTTMKPRIRRLMAKAYRFRANWVTVA